jgi:hypothetical protein
MTYCQLISSCSRTSSALEYTQALFWRGVTGGHLWGVDMKAFGSGWAASQDTEKGEGLREAPL